MLYNVDQLLYTKSEEEERRKHTRRFCIDVPNRPIVTVWPVQLVKARVTPVQLCTFTPRITIHEVKLPPLNLLYLWALWRYCTLVT